MMKRVNTDLQVISNVDEECARQRVDEDPPAGVKDLEALHPVVLQQHGEHAVVGVRRHPQREVRLRARRVAVHHQHLRRPLLLQHPHLILAPQQQRRLHELPEQPPRSVRVRRQRPPQVDGRVGPRRDRDAAASTTSLRKPCQQSTPSLRWLKLVPYRTGPGPGCPRTRTGELLAMSFPVLLVNTGMSSRRRGQVED
jgi:hypothetical protein